MPKALLRPLPSVTHEELIFVAHVDYGEYAEKHLSSLCDALTLQDGNFSAGQHFFPYEVVELGAHALTAGHEREFVLCTLLVTNAVASGFDTATNFGEKLSAMASTYDAFPSELRELVLATYAEFPRSDCNRPEANITWIAKCGASRGSYRSF